MKPVFIKLDKEREIKFGNRASIRFQSITGQSIFKVLSELENKQDVDLMLFNQMLYVALISKNPEIESVEEVIDLVDEYSDMETLIQKCMEAFEASGFFKNAKAEKKKKR